MRIRFRLYLEREVGVPNAGVTGIVPGLPQFDEDDDLPDGEPAIVATGTKVAEVRASLALSLGRALASLDTEGLSAFRNHHPDQRIEWLELEIQARSDCPEADGNDRFLPDMPLRIPVIVGPWGQDLVRVDIPTIHPRLVRTAPAGGAGEGQLTERDRVAIQETVDKYLRYAGPADVAALSRPVEVWIEELDVTFTPGVVPGEGDDRAREGPDPRPVPTQHRLDKASEPAIADAAPELPDSLAGLVVNLSDQVGKGDARPAVQRDREVEAVLRALGGSAYGACVVVGPSGVGKTAIIRSVTALLAGDRCPAMFRGYTVWRTSGNHLVVGGKYLGTWQSRINDLVKWASARKVVLYFEDLPDLIESGRVEESESNIAQFLRPSISDGRLKVLGECTPDRYESGDALDPGFLALFRTVRVEPMDDEVTSVVLATLAAGLEKSQRVTIEPAVLPTLMRMTHRYEPYRAEPGRSIQRLGDVVSDAEQVLGPRDRVVSRQVAVGAYARLTGLPEFLLSDNLTLGPDEVADFFGERIIGQPDAVEAAADLVAVIKAGLGDPHKPLGNLFCTGPSGAGKTEWAKTLAAYLFGSPDRLVRFDMSEYVTPMDVARLLGSTHGAEGELTRTIRQKPLSVVLFDEIEKANPVVFDVLLQVLGEGRVTDSRGRTADFRSAIVIFTSNLGTEAGRRRPLGLGRHEDVRAAEAHFRSAVDRFFRPEFVNRLDRVVVFRPLDDEAMRRIAYRELDLLFEREGFLRREIVVEVDERVVDLLMTRGFSPDFGARPLKRAVEQEVAVPMARFLVGQQMDGPRLVRLARDGDGIRLSSVVLPASRRAQQADRPDTPDLGALAGSFAGLVEGLTELVASPVLEHLRRERQALLALTQDPTVSLGADDGVRIWGRIHALDRLVRRADQLRDQAEYLAEMAALVWRQRDRRYRSDLAGELVRLSQSVRFLELEIAHADDASRARAFLRLAPVGRGRQATSALPWVVQLAGVYLRWARRKGLEYAVWAPTRDVRLWAEAQGRRVRTLVPGFEAGEDGSPDRPAWARLPDADVPDLEASLAAIAPREVALQIDGPNVFGFLSAEAGLHRWHSGTRGTKIARLAVAGPAPDQDIAAWLEAKADIPGTVDVAREFRQGANTGVEDPRTGVVDRALARVLDGYVDVFLLAAVALESRPPE